MSGTLAHPTQLGTKRRVELVTPSKVADDYSDEPHGEAVPISDATMREGIHTMTLAVTALAKAQTPTNGSRTQRNTIIAALLIAFVPQVFNIVWWTRGAERDSISKVERHQERINELTEEVATLKTWNEKLRNNMAAYGWLIDGQGNVSHIDKRRAPNARDSR